LSAAVRELDGIAWTFGLAEAWSFEGGLVPVALLPPADASGDAFEQARQRAANHPLIGGRLLSEDGRTTLLMVRLAGNALSIADVTVRVEALRETLAPWAEASGIEARLTGVPPIRVEIYDTVQREVGIFMTFGALACILVAAAIFRRFGVVLVASFGPVLGSIWTLGAMGLTGNPLDLMSSALPTLVIAIGFTDAIHLVVDMRRSRAEGAGRMEASRSAILHLGLPCALTSITTAIGFGSLVVGDVEIIRGFGLAAAGGVVLTFVSVITTVPLGAALLPELGGRSRPAREMRWGGLMGDVAAWIVDRPRRVASVGIVVTLVLLGISWQLEPDNRLTEATPRGNESFQALREVERAFGGVLPVFVLVEWDRELGLTSPEVREALEGAAAAFDADPLTSRSMSILNVAALAPPGRTLDEVVRSMPSDAAQRLVRPDLSRALVSANITDMPTAELKQMASRVEAQLRQLEGEAEGVRLYLTGTNVVGRANVNAIISSLAEGLIVAAGAIFLVMMLEFRSLRMALVSLVPNVFPLVFVGGLMVALDVPLKIATALVFTVLLGLAVDDTIHVLARYRRERAAGHDVRTAVERSVRMVGRALLVTTTVLVCGFAPSLISSMPTSVVFTAFVMVGLLAALIGDLVLLPALLMWAFDGPDADQQTA
jgi:hypothetical protein